MKQKMKLKAVNAKEQEIEFILWDSGDHISSTLFNALEESRISVVVFSEEFALSTWCLEELDKILECRKMKNQIVLPIFYNVDPSDVRKEKRAFGDAMARHEKRFPREKVQKWRSALHEVANISGWSFDSCKYEYELIQKVVEDVTYRLPRYNVYLSFREKDTGYSFTGFLYDTLHRQGFRTIMKDKGFESADEDRISESLVTAIENSRLSIVVLSENYAYSSSCLDELAMILDRVKDQNHMVWPIFYKLEPSEVRHQRNSYDKAMTEHENKFGKDSEKVQKWRSALFEVANLKGWHLKSRYEYEAIEKIVNAAIKFCSSAN
ncbi:disease resistance protein RPV1-like [Lotus japonicus]|uniref:disease resistance protein RPV1-like n=1 Tax=Lotus japonicus TaxID=34305 RepID=UPI002584EE20|nr:disease resistance protein RPV1-like [Lotus japonicus]